MTAEPTYTVNLQALAIPHVRADAMRVISEGGTIEVTRGEEPAFHVVPAEGEVDLEKELVITVSRLGVQYRATMEQVAVCGGAVLAYGSRGRGTGFTPLGRIQLLDAAGD